MIRLKKLCKISCKPSHSAVNQTWRLIPEPAMIAVPEAMLAVIQQAMPEKFDMNETRTSSMQETTFTTTTAKGQT
jgi:hypothetical protein